jgi:hypothetical protein
MPRREKKDVEMDDYRHDEKRPNNPGAGPASPRDAGVGCGGRPLKCCVAKAAGL